MSNSNSRPLFPGAFRLSADERLIPFDEWPSTSAWYGFESKDDAPELQMDFIFNAKAYSIEAEAAEEEKEAMKQKAADDLLVYLELCSLLGDTEKCGISFNTSLENAVDAEKKISVSNHAIDAQQLISKLIIPAIDVLKTAAQGVAVPDKAIPFTIVRKPDVAGITQLPCIMPLTVNIVMQQFDDTKTVVSEAGTPISPVSAGGGVSLPTFARNFEAAFTNRPANGVVYKLAAPYGNNKANAPLWLVRFDVAGKAGLKYSFDNTQPHYFAPAPLSNNLQFFAAEIKQYVSGKPFPAGSLSKQFEAVDTDMWAKEALEAIDKFLTPAYAVPALMLHSAKVFSDVPDYLQVVLKARRQLAEAISRRVKNIFIEDESDTIAAQNAWKEQLAVQLGSAYSNTASVQINAEVQSEFKEEGPVPLLYGNLQNETEIQLSPAGIPLADGKAAFNYLYHLPVPADACSFPVAEIAYHPRRILVQGNGGIAPVQLSFIIPVEEEIGGKASPLVAMAAVGNAEVPAPLRAFPAQPQVLGHDYDQPEQGDLSAAIKSARTWNYNFTYKNSNIAQDNTVIKITFNNRPGTLPGEAFGPDTNKLNTALARFSTIYPAISKDFDTALTALTAETLVSTSPVAVKARYALQAFADTVHEIADAWEAETGNDDAVMKDSRQQGDSLHIKINEYADASGSLLLGITPANAAAENTTHIITIPGYTCEDADGAYKYYNVAHDGTKTYLAYSDRNSEPLRVVSVKGLDVLKTQNANGAAAHLRNERLLLNADGSWKTTHPDFIYQTSEISLPDALTPRLDVGNIDISAITTPQYPMGGYRSLSAHLSALFDALLEDAPADSYATKLDCKYSFQLPGTDIVSELPITIAAPQLERATAGKDVAEALNSTIAAWFDSAQPETNAGNYVFNISLFSDIEPAETVLQLHLRLPLGRIAAESARA